MKKHLAFYNKCMESGYMPLDGLCICARYGFLDEKIFANFIPTEEEKNIMELENKCSVMWASDMHELDVSKEIFSGFTPLRQTIVLFMAAINGEL